MFCGTEREIVLLRYIPLLLAGQAITHLPFQSDVVRKLLAASGMNSYSRTCILPLYQVRLRPPHSVDRQPSTFDPRDLSKGVDVGERHIRNRKRDKCFRRNLSWKRT